MRIIAPVVLVACAVLSVVPGCGTSSGGAAAPGPTGTSGTSGAAGAATGGSGGAMGGAGGSSAGAAGASAGSAQGGSAGGGQPVSQLIVAADGGTLSAAGISVVIPPGALAVDTTVTLAPVDKSAQPNAAIIASKQVFDLGPNGTTFAKPVSLTLDYDAASVPAGKLAKVAYLDKGAWVSLPDSAASNGKITATTTHFTLFGGIGEMGAGGAGGASGASGASGAGGGAAGGTGGLLDGTWTWNTDTCGSIDLKAFTMGLGIQTVNTTYAGSSAQVIVIYPDMCTRTNQMTITYPSPGTISLDTAGQLTCSAGCPAKECTPTTNSSMINTYSYSVTGTTLTTMRTLTAADVMGTLDGLAGCKAGDVEISTQTKL